MPILQEPLCINPGILWRIGRDDRQGRGRQSILKGPRGRKSRQARGSIEGGESWLTGSFRLVGSEDSLIYHVAQTEERVILTLDLDFSDIRIVMKSEFLQDAVRERNDDVWRLGGI